MLVTRIDPQGGLPHMLNDYRNSLTRRRLSPNTIRLRLYWMQRFAKYTDLESASIDDMERWLDVYRKRSDNTRATMIASLRSFYDWAARTGRLEGNRAEELLRIRVERIDARMASEQAIRDGLSLAGTPDEAMILLGAECGMRVSEIAGLHRDSRRGEWLHIVGKGGRRRKLHVSRRLAALLDEIERTTMRWGYYFPGRSIGHMHPSTVWKHIRTLTGCNPHSLRHRAGTVVYRGTGRDIRVAQEFLGHASSVTTEIYVHVELDDLVRAGEATAIAA